MNATIMPLMALKPYCTKLATSVPIAQARIAGLPLPGTALLLMFLRRTTKKSAIRTAPTGGMNVFRMFR